MDRRRIMVLLLLAVMFAAAFAGVASAKAHVPLGDVQVSHKGTAKTIDAPALRGHMRHGDFQLPACDFANVFLDGDDVSGIADNDGDGLADAGLNPRDDAGGVTPACPPGTF